MQRKMRKKVKQKIYYEKNKDRILDSKNVFYQKIFNAVGTQRRAYYKENAASKKCCLLPITENIFSMFHLQTK